MNIQTKPIVKQNVGRDDIVMILRVSAASMDLYSKLKSAGKNWIKCPCSCSSANTFKVVEKFYTGFVLKEVHENFYTCSAMGDFKKI